MASYEIKEYSSTLYEVTRLGLNVIAVKGSRVNLGDRSHQSLRARDSCRAAFFVAAVDPTRFKAALISSRINWRRVSKTI